MTVAWTVTMDSAHPRALADFWSKALGYVVAPPPKGFDNWDAWKRHFDVPETEWDDVAALVDPDGVGPRISFLKVPESKVAKNRVHLDVQVGGGRFEPVDVRLPKVRAKVAELTAAGGTVVAEHEHRGQLDHVEMADPEGNEFCVL
jgi:hypothetical protein